MLPFSRRTHCEHTKKAQDCETDKKKDIKKESQIQRRRQRITGKKKNIFNYTEQGNKVPEVPL